MKSESIKRILFKIAMIALFACFSAGLISLHAFADTVNIYSAEEFVAYSQAYAAGEKNANDVLNIAITSGSEITNENFISIGTSDRPFAGTLVIPTAGIDTFRLFECPLFDYVSTDMQITGAGTVKIIRDKIDYTPSGDVLTSGALFANHVVNGTNAANWSIILLPYSGSGIPADSFEGVIGDIAANATVTVNFNNTSDMDAEGDGDVGLICGSLGAGATLNVTTAGSGSNISVTSSSGNAGSLVGKMNSGSTLRFNSANNSRVNSVTSNDQFAGGIVGYADNVTIAYGAGITDYAVSGTVTGKRGAGGLFGYYKNVDSPVIFGLEKYSIASGMTMSSTEYAGGVFGVLENTGASFTFDGNASNSEVYTVVLNGGASSGRGGFAGGFKTNALTNVLTVRNFKPTVTSAILSTGYTAGIIGKVIDSGGASAAYIVIDGETDSKSVEVTVTSAGASAVNGGLIGDIGSLGSFVDVKGAIKVSGKCYASLVSNMSEGILRIKGTTDLSGYVADGSTFVKSRGRALVYALGDGTGTNGDWTLLRNLSNACDDIGSWGQVLRTDGTILSESDLFTVDDTAHTVTVKGAYTTIDNVTKFALTALNMQLNTAAAVGALQFTSGSENQSANLLADTITLGADITLAGTGLTGFTRDSGENNTMLTFTGVFDGGSHTITLATGEPYGLDGTGAALVADSKQGNIYRHGYNGLFARINGASAEAGIVQDLTLSGTVYLNQKDELIRFGGVTALAGGYCTLSDVDANPTIKFTTSNDTSAYIGGVIGAVATTGTISIDSGASGIKPTFTDSSSITANTNSTLVGGAIGYVSTTTSNQSVTFESGSKIGINYTKNNKNARTSVFGAAIASVANAAYKKDRRTITFEDTVYVDITANGASGSSKKFGGILGCDWYAADVTVNNIEVSNASITANAYSDFGGLVQYATGYWDLQSIALTSGQASFSLPGGTFGFVANKTYISTATASSALYLDLVDADYDIGALSFTSTPSFSTFDEIVASSKGSAADIVSNGNSIISITTSGNVINTSGTVNVYQNRTTYGTTVSDKEKNAGTRYYYNIDYARANTATSKYNFLVWTVGKYAHSSLSEWFPASSTFTGNLDMTGLSYYPIDLTSAVTFNNVTSLKLDNNLMETWVKTAYSGTDTRTTRENTNQHYLMHTAVFRNVTANITVSGNDGMTMQGNVPKLTDSFCGFLIAGNLGGTDTPIKFNAKNLVFDGVFVSDGGNHFSDTTYAPLFINRAGRNTTITINGAEQKSTGYTSLSGYAGSSLIGNVGSTTDRAIYLTFSGLKFDSRNSATAIGNMNTVYGTSKAIFSRATILNSFLYDTESSGSYNYAIEEDWSNSTTAIHKVTYGKEITTSSEFALKEKKYYGSTYYTHPTAFESASEYDFSTGFLPYVYVAYDLANYKHELSVNVTFASVIEGCGKYGDPYIIDDDEKLPIIAGIINGSDVGSTVQIYLPTGTHGVSSCDYTGTTYTKYLYNFGTTNFTSSNGGASQTNTNVRKYLAGAYYVITKDITLPKTYASLGSVSSAEYAFRGLIIGQGESGLPTITNESRNPLIHTAQGCVVKDVIIDVNVNYNSTNVISLAAPLGSDTYQYSGGVQTYGAVIGQILGGDNFIDNVQVSFTDAEFSITKATSSNYERLTPIGGYVGTLFNGGLIFRNMAAANAEDKRFVGLTSDTCSYVSNSGYLYVNPIIGRVISGYAFYEGTTYYATEDTATLKNGLKNYTIADLSLSAGKLSLADSGTVYTVSIPDGQALFILGAAINCGATSAPTDGTPVDGILPYSSLSLFWQAYRAHTTVRGGAAYTGVGTASGDDYTQASLDKYTGNTCKVPYIVRAYTDNETSATRLRSLTTRNNNVLKLTGNCDVAAGFRGIGNIYINNATNGSSNNQYTQLGISKMTGQIGSTTSSYKITLHMNYREYNHKSVSAYIATASSTVNTDNTAGFGLFNRLNMTSSGSSNSVQYITLSGSVFYDVYTINGVQANYNFSTFGSNDRTENSAPNNNTEDMTFRRTILSVGGLAGIINEKAYIKNVTFDDLSVEGAKSAGGLIGFVHIGNTNILQIEYGSGITNAGYVNVVGGLQAGGLIGRIYRTQVDIAGASGGTDIIIKNVESKNKNPDETGMYYFANINTGVGGIVGTCWAIDKANNGTGNGDSSSSLPSERGNNISSRKLFITNINVVKGDSAANVRVLNDGETKTNYAGGFVGSAHNTFVKLKNCKLISVNVTANTAGGFVGKLTQKYYLEISGCSADGNSIAAISGTRFAGGAVGWAIGRDYLYFQLFNFSIEDYLIESTMTGENIAGAGGVLGYAQGNNVALDSNSNYICEFNNIAVLHCTVKTNYTNNLLDYLKYKNGTGGIIGVIDVIYVKTENKDGHGPADESIRTSNGREATSNKYKFSGYNILVKDCTLTHKNGGVSDDNTSATNRRIGDIVGNNAVQTPLKLVGVSVENSGYYINVSTNGYCGKHSGYFGSDADDYGVDPTSASNANYYGDGYVVFANFNATSGGTTMSNIVGGTNVAAAYPYVTVNPTLDIGTWHLTGDGVASSVNDLAIQEILLDGVNGVYKYAASAYYSGSSGVTNYAAFNALKSKLVMFSSEVTDYLGTDFPILILDDMDHDNSHKQINSYLRLLTNTLHDFGNDVTKEYSVSIYNMSYENGAFVQSTTGASLRRVNGKFYMSNAFDTGKTQFSLIDVRFFDPADKSATQKVAYHLYVPVFVKKVLSYQFDIAVHSGTEYLRSIYEDRFGRAIIENLGTPVTFFFRYTYTRTNAEWTNAINAGESVNRNYAKKLQFNKANNNSALNDLPGDTILVLVDPNNGGKPYYAKLSDALTLGNVLDLGAFREVMTKSGDTVVFSGNYFTPKKLGEFMSLSVRQVGGGADTMVACDLEYATVVVSGQGYRLATDLELSDSETPKYTVTASGAPIIEQYYISVFTESNAVNDELFHYYLVQSPSSFEETEFPSRITDTGAHSMVHFVMGKIFYHDDFSISSDSKTGDLVMSNDNNSLTVTMIATLGISLDLPTPIREDMKNIISSTEVYQGFLVYLNRVEGANTSKAILGNPTGSGDYYICYVDPDPVTPYTESYYVENGVRSVYSDLDVRQNLAQFISSDLHANLATGNYFVIYSNVELLYRNDAIPTQFPGRSNSVPDNGVWISGSSNIGFTTGSVTNSKNITDGEETPQKRYYSEADPDVATLDLNPIGDRVGDFTSLGINALNMDSELAVFDLLAVLDVTNIYDLIADYNDTYINVTLARKQNDGTYVGIDDISLYMSMEMVGSGLPAMTDNGDSYSAILSKTYLSGNGAEIILPTLRFTVKTGSDFESAGYIYSNYRINVAVSLRNNEGTVYSPSRAENFVIYSNVKVFPSFLGS